MHYNRERARVRCLGALIDVRVRAFFFLYTHLIRPIQYVDVMETLRIEYIYNQRATTVLRVFAHRAARASPRVDVVRSTKLYTNMMAFVKPNARCHMRCITYIYICTYGI